MVLFFTALFIQEIPVEQQLYGRHSARKGTGKGGVGMLREKVKYGWDSYGAYGLVEEIQYI